MKMIYLRGLMFLAALFLFCGAAMSGERPGNWAQPVISVKLGNFYKVSDEVFRSEQPEKHDIPDLKSLNIRTLLNLREYHSDDAIFEQSGFQLVRHKMDAGDLSVSDLITVLKLLRKAEKPVLIHCWHGSDRTGFIIAGYRIVFQNWTKEAAIEELRQGGFGYHAVTYPNITKVLQGMDADAVKKAVLDEK